MSVNTEFLRATTDRKLSITINAHVLKGHSTENRIKAIINILTVTNRILYKF